MYTRDMINTDASNYTLRNLDICLSGTKDMVAPFQQEGAGKALAKMTKVELYGVAKRFDVKGRSTMNKTELIVAIRKAARKSTKTK